MGAGTGVVGIGMRRPRGGARVEVGQERSGVGRGRGRGRGPCCLYSVSSPPFLLSHARSDQSSEAFHFLKSDSSSEEYHGETSAT